MGKCAYCGRESKLTREHLFPQGIDSMFLKGEESGHFFLTRSPSQFVEAGPTVRDVCASCNNGILSQLDAYAIQLLARQCSRYLRKGEVVTLDYSYDLLFRWLLKIAYNSARVHENDVEMLRRCRGYILGKSMRPKRAAVFLRLIHSYVLTERERGLLAERGESIDALDHNLFRSSLIRFATSGKAEKVGRAITFKSFMFNILILGPKSPHTEFQRFCDDFLRHAPGAVLVRPDRPSIIAKAEEFDTQDALAGHFALQGDAYDEPWKKFQERQADRKLPTRLAD